MCPCIRIWPLSQSLTLFIGNGEIFPGSALVLIANEIRNLLVLGLFDSRLIALISSTHILLYIIDSYQAMIPSVVEYMKSKSSLLCIPLSK